MGAWGQCEVVLRELGSLQCRFQKTDCQRYNSQTCSWFFDVAECVVNAPSFDGGGVGGQRRKPATQLGNFERHFTIPSLPQPIPPTPTDTMAHHAEDDSYHPKDAISTAIRALTITGGIGFIGAAAQVTIHKQNMSPLAVVTRFGGTITMLGMRYIEQ